MKNQISTKKDISLTSEEIWELLNGLSQAMNTWVSFLTEKNKQQWLDLMTEFEITWLWWPNRTELWWIESLSWQGGHFLKPKDDCKKSSDIKIKKMNCLAICKLVSNWKQEILPVPYTKLNKVKIVKVQLCN